MTTIEAVRIGPAEPHRDDRVWCSGCDKRVDRAPLAGGCGCPRPHAGNTPDIT